MQWMRWPMSALPPDLDIGRDEAFDKARWDRAMAWIAAKIRTHDAFQPSWETAVNELRQFGLVRLNDAVEPVYARLTAIAQLGALFTATSSSSVAVGVGTKVFEIAEEDRERFAAAAYLAIQKAGDPTVAMWGPLSSYNRDTGLLTVLVEQAVGDGSADTWIISASGAPDATHAGRADNPHGVTAAQVGAPTAAEMASAIADAIAALKDNVSAGYDTLKKIEDKLAPVLAGATAAYDTFAEINAYITSDQSAAAAVNTALANRLRVDAAQGLTVAQKAQARSNIGLGTAGAMAGLRNKMLNPNFAINQRAVAGNVVLAAGAYGHDGWKAGAAGCTYSFATADGVTTLTITAGSLVQVVEGGWSLSASDTYVLSWSGSAQGRINGGAYGISGAVTAQLTGGSNATVEFGAGTLAQVQLERGASPTSFEDRPQIEMSLCQRYRETALFCVGNRGGDTYANAHVNWAVPKRTAYYAYTFSVANVTARAADQSSLTFNKALSSQAATLEGSVTAEDAL